MTGFTAADVPAGRAMSRPEVCCPPLTPVSEVTAPGVTAGRLTSELGNCVPLCVPCRSHAQDTLASPDGSDDCSQHGMKKQQAGFTRSVQARGLTIWRVLAVQRETPGLLLGKDAVMRILECSTADGELAVPGRDCCLRPSQTAPQAHWAQYFDFAPVESSPQACSLCSQQEQR